MYKSRNIAAELAEKMAMDAHVEIGTRGTVGSLIMREIEHFSQLEISSQDSSRQPQSVVEDIASSSTHPRPTMASALRTQKKQRRRASRLPRVCSMVEVSDNSRPIRISSLRSLKSDTKKLQA